MTTAGDRRRPDRFALVAGIVIAALGVVLLLDASGALALSFGALAPVALGTVGAILLASGLTRGA